jgi:hypothetical protein
MCATVPGSPRRRHLPFVLTLGIVLGAGATLVQWRLACRIPEAEACVWGRAYLPVSLVLGGIAGLVLAAIAFTVMRAIAPPEEAP